MKKLLLLGLICIAALQAATQGLPYPQYQFSGSETTRFEGRGAVQGRKGLINGTYTDTTQANLGYIDFYPGAQIFTTNDNFVWLRNSTATRWLQQGAISNITINNVITNSTTSITLLTDSSVRICTGDGSCDTVIFNTSVTNITTTFFITDSSFVVCDSLASCDTIIIPSVGPLFIYQNWLEQRVPGIVEWGGLSAGGPAILLHDTYNSTEWWRQFYYSKSLRDYGYQFHSLQGFHETPGIMSWRSQGTYPVGGSHIPNTVRLGVNFTDTVTAFSPATTGIFGNVHNGYFISSNLWGGDPQGTVRTDDFLSKSAGVFFHTKDLSNSNKNAVSIFGQAPIGSANTGGIKMDTTLIASFKTDKNLQLYGYPDARDDGGTSKALFTDTDGNVLYGPLNTGDVITIITDSSISICSNVHHVTSVCDTFITNVLTGPIQTVEILNDSTIVVCDSLSVCDTLVVPQTDFSQPITADNGLIMSTPTNVQLGAPTFPGAPLLHHTYIDATANYTLRMTGSISNQAVYQVYNTGTGQAILAQATGTGTALNARNIGATGTALNAYSANGLPMVVGTQPASTNTVVQMIKIQRESSSTAASGIGGSIDFLNETDNGNVTNISNRIISKWTDAGIGTRSSQYEIWGVNNTSSVLKMSIGSAATLINATRFEEYEGADVVAANDLTLGTDGNVFTMTGNTAVNAITIADWQEGSSIGILITGTPTLNHNTAGGAGTEPLALAGGVNFTVTSQTYMEFRRKDGFWHETSRKQAAAAGVYTFRNALTESPAGTVEWGATGLGISPLLHDTYINGNTFSVFFGSNVATASGVVTITNSNTGSSATALGVVGNGSTAAISANNNGTGSAILGTAISGTAITGASTSGMGAAFSVNPSSTTTVVNVMELTRNTTGTAANGMGGRIQGTLENSAGTRFGMAYDWYWTDVTDATRTTIVRINNVSDAVTREKIMVGGSTTLTESAATTFHTHTATASTSIGGEIVVTVEANDATDFQSRTLRFIWSAVNKSNTTTVVISTPEEVVAVSAGTLTVTITAVDAGGGVINFQANAVSSLTQTVLRASAYAVRNY